MEARDTHYRQFVSSQRPRPCVVCGTPTGVLVGRGRSARWYDQTEYCSAACKQKAYRQRRKREREEPMR